MTLWLLGGHDPTHGAGLYRDLVTARQLAPVLSRRFAVTALTEQGRGSPARAVPVPAERLRARVRRWPTPLAVKVGLVPDPVVSTVVELLEETGAPLVVDPVLRASDGGGLGSSAAGLRPLLARAILVTPNRAEAIALASEAELGGEALALAVSRRLPGVAVLLKDGHGSDPERVVDRLVIDHEVISLSRPRRPGPDPRGTGCALATAIAVGLAEGRGLADAVATAVAWLDQARAEWHPGPDGRAHLPDGTAEPPSMDLLRNDSDQPDP